MCPLNDNCSCHEDDWTQDADHMCTDWELCGECWLCVGCCTCSVGSKTAATRGGNT